MATLQCFKLHFSAPLHLGRGIGETYDTGSRMMHSDAISAAIASARVFLFGEKNLKHFLESLRVSSAFPFYHNSYFFPKPMMKLAIQVDDKDELKAGKMLKKLEYIELPLFEKLIGGQQLQVSKQQFSPGNKYLWGDTAKTKEFLKTDIQQRVTVPHDGQGDSVPYYVERLFFVQGAGLFFIMECNDTKVLKETEVSLKYLEDAGIGTDRAVGNGFFRVKKCSLEIALQTTAMHTMNLSLFCPAKDELPALLQGEPAYLLEKRGGYIAGATDEKFRHLRKKTVYMFTEGSIFNVSKLNGKVLDMRPEWNDNNLHPVYRSGQPVGIPVLIKQA